ncbi:LAMI_0H17722g1_1 [Lachancea mirantina]|uniref:LAMI_0H17722g1_1 n=1 Tax=Lachancea mirantina TaxID=1230905 RepID=A0A1G4KJC8_9SACH|nr:LAMI_0H17722g1_1 [Lachancea mirantina]
MSTKGVSPQENEAKLAAIGEERWTARPKNDIVRETSHKDTKQSNVAQKVTPEILSQLLLIKGPLAIRFITQALAEAIPGFKALSASKQRRVIMGVLETGDAQNGVVFAKIGWGQWSARKVDPEVFEKEREATNIANAKIKDAVSQERRRSSSSKRHGSRKEREFLFGSGSQAGFLFDENALASEEEDEDIDADEEDASHATNYDVMKRRKSSVVFADAPEDLDNELKWPSIRPLLKNNRRRSSSKVRAQSISKPGSFRGSVVSLGSSGSTELITTAALDLKSRSSTDLQASVDHDQDLGANRLHNREARMSFSKESSIRSTLLAHASHRVSPLQKAVESLPVGGGEKVSHSNFSSTSPQPLRDLDQSDTDEEDWERIGAASLRNSSDRSSVQSPQLEPTAPLQQPPRMALATSPKLPTADTSKKRTHRGAEDPEDAAFLLMSLKS